MKFLLILLLEYFHMNTNEIMISFCPTTISQTLNVLNKCLAIGYNVFFLYAVYAMIPVKMMFKITQQNSFTLSPASFYCT
jgi:hypothetical protein